MRKVVVPLVPHVKGPFWESHIGHCGYDPFHMYRIQLFNGNVLLLHSQPNELIHSPDTPYPIDPFAFISAASEDRPNSQVDLSSTGPPLPGASQTLVGTSARSTSRRSINPPPKTAFPEAHLGTLLAKMTDLSTPNLTYLVESIYQDLRAHKIRKNAIEAKVREIGEKCKDKKVWVVKQTGQVGTTPSRDTIDALKFVCIVDNKQVEISCNE
ncbi:hypothetical protein JVU11DRAFT_626 [Chiua virens]|nr:hypothetical protein JVU11DRAFT_626 [Chiua virens]